VTAPPTTTPPTTTQPPSPCQQHIELHSAKRYAEELGQSEMQVLASFKVNLWEKPSAQGKGRKVGEMLPGSRAVVLQQSGDGDDYRVRSPLDQSTGWVSSQQVTRTLFQSVDTRESCTP